LRVAGYPAGLEVGPLMTARTAHCRRTMPVRTPLDRRLVQPRRIALTWAITGRVAIDAAGMGQHLAKLGEVSRGARLAIRDRREAFGACQCGGSALRSGVACEHIGCQRRESSENLQAPLEFHFSASPEPAHLLASK